MLNWLLALLALAISILARTWDDTKDIPPSNIDAVMEIAATESTRLNEQEMRWVLDRAGWSGQELEEALAVSWCESRWQPAARNGVMLGLFQMWDGWWTWSGWDISSWADPVANAALARKVYMHRGRWGGGGGWACAPN